MVVQLLSLSGPNAYAASDRQAPATVFVSDTSAMRIDGDLSPQVYGFTPAEPRFPGEMAARSNVRGLTLRTQLPSLFGKTHTRRQP